MKVLQINAVYGYKSTGTIVKDIDELVQNSGGESFVAYQTCSVKPLNGYRVGNKFDWKRHALLSRVFGKQGYFSKRATKKLLKWMDGVNPDVVHLHNLHSNYINLPLLLKYLAEKNIATVVTLHDCWFFTGKCFHYADIACDRFKYGCGCCPKKNYSPRSYFTDKSSNMIEDKNENFSAIKKLKIVGCSEWICREAKKSIFKNFDIQCVWNGVDTNVFKKYDENDLASKYNAENKFIILGMADKWLLDRNKGVLDKVIGLLSQDVNLMLIGCDKKNIDILNKKSPYIIPIEYIRDREELAKHYCLANVFVNITHADTLPTVNMESICCGTPVITYDSCGSPELVGEKQGIIVKEDDEDALIKAITCVMKNEATFEFAERIFDKNENYKKYLEIYKEMAEKS